uniref:Ovule protein n=1 Tax=Angiostrongylus cantonensis TaxID=6313 RepID=A0A0K0DC27_ANGCA
MCSAVVGGALQSEPSFKTFKLQDTEKRYLSLFHFIWPVEMCLLMVSDKINEVRQNARSFLVNSLCILCERTLLKIRIYITVVVCLLISL